MRLQRLSNLLSPRRLGHCRRLFTSPLQAHLWLSGLVDGELELEFRAGGRLRFPPYRRARALWSYLLAAPDARDPRVEGDLLTFRHAGAVRLGVRPRSSDFGIFDEIWLRDAYRVGAAGRPLDTVIDLGANVGMFTARAATAARRVIAVEPVGENRAVAARNVALAGVADRVRLLPYAAAGRSGERVKIFLSSASAASHSLLASHGHLEGSAGHEEVETISLPDLFAREGVERCSLLKCDIEGAEFDVFAATPPEVLDRIDALAVEVHTSAELPPGEVDALRARLAGAGFDVTVEKGWRYQGSMDLAMLFAVRPEPVRT
jgi:FkbM family methyltransferase